jgi:hypothetical protein
MARSLQSRGLAWLLTDLPVEVSWSTPSGAATSGGGWVRWFNGPTIARMQAHVAFAESSGRPALADQVAAFDPTTLRYDRGSTALAEAAALLTYLEAHPDQAVAARPWMIHCTFDDAEHPERSRPRTLRWAAALCSLEPGPSISIEACEQLQHHARRALQQA